jgi:trk system potassium uptake protein TrkH
MLSAAAVALVYEEWSDAGSITAAAAVTIAIGLFAWKSVGSPGELTTKEGFAAVGLSWFAMCLVGMMPYLFTGAISGISDAFFETTAGFTTTGASVVALPEALSHGILFWRALTQWLGGMGIIILSVAILPLLGVGGVQLARAEAPGPTPDRLTPRFRETAKRLWFVYVGITALQVLFLWFGDMTFFEAVAHAFTTMSTGGFSTSSASLGGFSPYAQWVVIFFMFVAGMSFALHFRALRKPGVYVKDAEFWLYAAILVVAGTMMAIGTWGEAIADGLRDAVFTAVSLVTTTGYATADFGLWAPALQILAVALMFVGGMAGSTAGSVKIYRHGVLVSAARTDLRRLIHPRGVFVARLGRQHVPDEIVSSVQAFFLFYMFLFTMGTLAFGVIESATGHGLGFVEAASAVASGLGNVGPGLGEVGPASNFVDIATANKWLMSGLMIVGRLELFPVLLLFTRELWRR